MPADGEPLRLGQKLRKRDHGTVGAKPDAVEVLAVQVSAMKILFCVEFYHPNIGGAQEVVRQIAERMASYGHEVSVATTRIASRKSLSHNGVALVEFSVSGNNVRGLRGEVDRYRQFLRESKFDVVMFYAAQQWTFDAAWPIMPLISACKVLVPCGYSNLFETAYKTYFKELPAVLKLMDAV